jgi:pyridoxal biosynthesis lyase PdxS
MREEQYQLNKNLAQMLKGGVIMDVATPEQAKIAETAGACAVMALERIPADIRAAGGVSRMSDPKMIKEIQNAVSIPVMVNFAAGGVASPADAALMMQLGAEGVFVGSGIFKSGDPAKRAAAIVKAVTNKQGRRTAMPSTAHHPPV